MKDRYIISAEKANLILRHFEERPLREVLKAGFLITHPFEIEQTPEVYVKKNNIQNDKIQGIEARESSKDQKITK